MPKKNGELYADERRALAYRSMPLAGGAKLRRSKEARAVRLWVTEDYYDEMEKARRAAGHSNIFMFVYSSINAAMRGAKTTSKEDERERLRRHWKSEVERARRAGFDIPAELFE